LNPRLPESDSDFETILWIFRYQCVGLDGYRDRCDSPIFMLEPSHIEPKSRGEQAKVWTNVVPQCKYCHSEYHRRGITDDAIRELKERRAQFLEDMGRDEYI